MPSGLVPELAHVLAIELVATGRFSRDELPGVSTEFHRLVLSTPQARESLNSNSLLLQRREHSMHLVFLGDPLAALKCALQAANEARRRPNIRLRMGIHTGTVNVPADLTDERDCTGEGMTGASLLMMIGGEGHILASEPVARAASAVELWASYFHDLGEREVRPGNRVRLFNVHAGGIGNSEAPGRPPESAALQKRSFVAWISPRAILLTFLFLVLAGSAAAWFRMPKVRSWAESRYRGIFPVSEKKAVKKPPGGKKKVVRHNGRRTSRAGTVPEASVHNPDDSGRRSIGKSALESELEGAESESSYFSSLILNAKGLRLGRDQAIRIVNSEGDEIWSGMPSFTAGAGAARRFDIAGDQPLSVRGSAGGDENTIVISGSDARRLREATSENPFLDSNCVIVVN